jgi:CheY-like chemotaxis protein
MSGEFAEKSCPGLLWGREIEIGDTRRAIVVKEGNALHILIVDDEEIIADSLANILKDKGFAATAAYNGEQALELATTVEPDVLLSDVVMPGISGVELALRLIRLIPSCRIVLYSSIAVVTNLLKAPGATNYPFTLLAKPIHPDDLIAHLTALAGPIGLSVA